MKKKIINRNSSIELLKIIAIVIIIISHSVPYGVYSNYAGFIDLRPSTSMSIVILAIFRYFGQIGNAIFVICSSWFLIDSKKANKKKVLKIIIDSFIICLGSFIFVKYVISYDIQRSDYSRLLFPVVHNTNWFITCYLLFYLIHPLLNYALDKMDKTSHLNFCILFIFLYSILPVFINTYLYYSPFIGFVIIYFIVGYIKKYMSNYSKNLKLNVIIFLLTVVFFVGRVFIINYLSIKEIYVTSLLKYNIFINPTLLLLSISLFNIANSKEFYCNIINKISSLSLLIYLIHGNPMSNGYMKGMYFDYILHHHNYKYIVIYSLILAVIYIIGSLILSALYKMIASISIDKIIDKVYEKLRNIYNKIINKLLIYLH